MSSSNSQEVFGVILALNVKKSLPTNVGVQMCQILQPEVSAKAFPGTQNILSKNPEAASLNIVYDLLLLRHFSVSVVFPREGLALVYPLTSQKGRITSGSEKEADLFRAVYAFIADSS